MNNKISLIFTVEPAEFFANPLTVDNFFQFRGKADPVAAISARAIGEHRTLRENLAAADVASAFITGPKGHPDAIFPNNSFSFHEKNGLVLAILYPMSPGRRNELPQSFIDFLKTETDEVYDLRYFEAEGKYLEGTGVLNFNADEDAVYMGRSERANEDVLAVACDILDIDLKNRFVFDMKDEQDRNIYHTNVINWVGEDIFAVCWASIPDGDEKQKLKAHAGKFSTIVKLSFEEINTFSGNALEVTSKSGNAFLTISESGYKGLSAKNKTLIDQYYNGRIIRSDVETIQKFGGGSVRCMEAEGSLSIARAEGLLKAFNQQYKPRPKTALAPGLRL